jgi:uncharacterized OsmC-like protein
MAELDTYLESKAQVLAARHADFQSSPDAGTASLAAACHVAGNTGVRPVRMGDYIVVTDSAPGLAGHSLGPTSPELLLGALASCLAHTYVLQAALRNIALDGVEIKTSGTVNFAQVVDPANTKDIAMQQICYVADIRTPEAAARMDELHAEVDKACVVLNTIRHASPVTRRESAV